MGISKKILKLLTLGLMIISANSYAEYEETPGVIQGTAKNVNFKLSARISQAGVYANDHNKEYLFLGNNSGSDSRMKAEGAIKLDPEYTLTGIIEYGVLNNSLDGVSQIKPSQDNRLSLRVLDAIFQTKYGVVSFGHGSTASDGTSEVDFSELDLAGIGSNPWSIGQELLFYNQTTNDYPADSSTSEKIFTVFTNLDGLHRQNRLRYDTPEFYGFKLSSSISKINKAHKNNYDVAVRYNTQLSCGTKVGGAFAIEDQTVLATRSGILKQLGHGYNGSAAVLFNSGIYLNIAGGIVNVKGQETPHFYYGKVGYLKQDLVSLGFTDIGAGYGGYNNFHTNKDRAHMVGAGVVQNIAKLNTSVFAKYSMYRLARKAVHFNNIHVIALGTNIAI